MYLCRKKYHITTNTPDDMKSTRSHRQHKQAAALSYPVSGKFLREIMQRVESATSIVSLSPTATEKLRQSILLYLDSRAVPPTNEAPEVILAFHLLKPEIDKAISRSEAARARAAKRREKKAEKAASTLGAPYDAPEKEDNDVKEQQTDSSEIQNQSAVKTDVVTRPCANATPGRKQRSRKRKHKRRSRR